MVCPRPPSQSETELEPELRSPGTMAQGQVLSEGGAVTLPTLSGSKLRHRAVRWRAQGPPAVATSEPGSSSSHEPLRKREGGRENRKGRWKRGEGREKDGGGELKGRGEESTSPWTGSP